RMWVRIKDGQAEVAALARGEDQMVERAAKDLAKDLADEPDDDPYDPEGDSDEGPDSGPGARSRQG
ncbi:MAG: cytochrome c biogenesis protein ResB, partial [Brevibacterium aurantiacum]